MNQYTVPELEIVEFTAADVITASYGAEGGEGI